MTVEEKQLAKHLPELESFEKQQRVLGEMVRDETYYAEYKKGKALQMEQIQALCERLQEVEKRGAAKREEYEKLLDRWEVQAERGLKLLGDIEETCPHALCPRGVEHIEDRCLRELETRDNANKRELRFWRLVLDEESETRKAQFLERIPQLHEKMKLKEHQLAEECPECRNVPRKPNSAKNESKDEQQMADELQEMERVKAVDDEELREAELKKERKQRALKREVRGKELASWNLERERGQEVFRTMKKIGMEV